MLVLEKGFLEMTKNGGCTLTVVFKFLLTKCHLLIYNHSNNLILVTLINSLEINGM